MLVGLVFGGKLTAAGDTEMVKFGSAVTVRVSVVLSTVEPLVPVTVMVAGPTAAVADAVNVSELPAAPVTEAGLKLAVTPTGRPLTVKATGLSKPPEVDTMILLAALVPCITTVPVPEMPNGVVRTGGKAFCTS